jgi:hypothetical protein
MEISIVDALMVMEQEVFIGFLGTDFQYTNTMLIWVLKAFMLLI